MNKNKFNWFLLVFLIGVLFYYYFLDPQDSKAVFFSCPLREFSGYLCPGCGGQRALHELLHFRLHEAFQFNALFVLGIFYCLLLWGTYFWKEKYFFYHFLRSKPFILFIVLAVIFYGIVRNL